MQRIHQQSPFHTAPEEFEDTALFLQLGVPSTLFRHENGAFEKRCSNRRNLKTAALRFGVDRNPFENIAFWKRWRHHYHVVSLTGFPNWPVVVVFSNFSGALWTQITYNGSKFFKPPTCRGTKMYLFLSGEELFTCISSNREVQKIGKSSVFKNNTFWQQQLYTVVSYEDHSTCNAREFWRNLWLFVAISDETTFYWFFAAILWWL